LQFISRKIEDQAIGFRQSNTLRDKGCADGDLNLQTIRLGANADLSYDCCWPWRNIDWRLRILCLEVKVDQENADRNKRKDYGETRKHGFPLSLETSAAL